MPRLICTALLLAACGGRANTAPAEAPGPDARAEAPVVSLHGTRPAEAKPAPEFRAVAQDGTPRTRADLLGKPTALWFYPAAATPG